jgi:hypothetical protein
VVGLSNGSSEYTLGGGVLRGGGKGGGVLPAFALLLFFKMR